MIRLNITSLHFESIPPTWDAAVRALLHNEPPQSAIAVTFGCGCTMWCAYDTTSPVRAFRFCSREHEVDQKEQLCGSREVAERLVRER